MAALGFGLSAIGQGASFIGQQNQTDAYNQAAQQNAINASVAASNQYADEQRRFAYDAKATNQQGFQQVIEARQAKGTAIASAGSSGLDASSISVQSILNNIDQQEARNEAVLQAKRDDAQSAYNSRTQSEYYQAIGRTNSMPLKSGPSPLALGLGIADSGLDAFSSTKYGKSWLGIDQ